MKLAKPIVLFLVAAAAVLLGGRAEAQSGNSVSVSDSAAVEGNALQFEVSLAQTPTAHTAVTFRVDPGTASTGEFTRPASTTLTFFAGQPRTQTVVVPTTADTTAEAVETISFVITGAAQFEDEDGQGTVAVTDGNGLGRILNDDFRLTVSDRSKGEGSSYLIFAVSLQGAHDQPVTFRARTQPGTAREVSRPGLAADYSALDHTFTFNAHEGQSQAKPVLVFPHSDETPELDETFTLAVSDVSVPLVGPNDFEGTGTILNDDAPPTLSIADRTVVEGDADGTARVRVTASPRAEYPIDYSFTTRTARSAEPFVDFGPESGRQTLCGLPCTASNVSVPIRGDIDLEPDEVFDVAISDPSAGATIADGTGRVTIDDDDRPVVTFQGSTTATEGDTVSIDIVLSKRVSHAVRVPWSAMPDTAQCDLGYDDQDFSDGPEIHRSDCVGRGTVEFEPGTPVLSQTVQVAIVEDDIIEKTERFFVAAGEVEGARKLGRASVHVLDDEGTYNFVVVPWTNPFDNGPKLSDIERRNESLFVGDEGTGEYWTYDCGSVTFGGCIRRSHDVPVNFSLWNVARTERITLDKAVELYVESVDGSAKSGAAPDYIGPRRGSLYRVFIPAGQETATPEFGFFHDSVVEPNEYFEFDYLEGYTSSGGTRSEIDVSRRGRVWLVNDD